MARLIIYDISDTDSVIEEFDLLIPRLLIGSAMDNDLVLDAPGIDPTHASLELRNDRWILQDLGGPTGTRVNDQVIEGPYQLQHGDLIAFGSVRLRFEEAPPTSDPKATEAGVRPEIRGRVWFAGVAGVTLTIIFLIILLLIIADYLQLLNIGDLLPPWLVFF